MKEDEIAEAIEYFQQKLEAIDHWHRYLTSDGKQHTKTYLKEMRHVWRCAGKTQRLHLYRLRRAMLAWFCYFRWRQSKPSLVRGQIIFGF